MRENQQILINTYNGNMDNIIINDFYNSLREGDIITVVHGNNQNPVDLDVLNQRLDNLRSSLSEKDLIWTVLCAAHTKLKEIATGLDTSKAVYIFYDYEPNFEPEFTRDFPTTLQNMEQAAQICRSNGFLAGTAPTGRGLFDYGFKQYNWDYGEIANRMDIMITQTQSELKSDYLNDNLDIPEYTACIQQLKSQLVSAGSKINVFPQITILSEGNPNGAPLEFCINGRSAIYDEGFVGVSIWWAPDAVNDVVELLKSFRVFNSRAESKAQRCPKK